MRIFFHFILLTICSFSFSQQKTFKQRSNHVVYIGLTNSMYWNNFEGLNDANNVVKRQFQPSIEVLGYLFSYEINNKIEAKIGYTHFSFLADYFSYLGNNNIYAGSNPHFSFLIDYQPLRRSNLFLSGGLKLAFFPYEETFINPDNGTPLAPKSQITTILSKGFNPMISFGVGKRRILFNKYRIEWLFSYNHGTNSLRRYEFIRFDPYVVSNLKTYNHHLSFTLRYYFKKYSQDDQ